ncbi:hypothetical protein OSB04_026166 [Centaurea solstitialis]|uniref:Myb-like domain-containing protein n=1 Tax=Centaurea solstitialis TaxID=347529 RepID=A0AA38W5N5_9ASTR|nr:hypothetical protein OSB04_026166 [Centaurea solstitialis]
MRSKSSENAKLKHKKGLWSPDEDQNLRDYIVNHGLGCWSAVPIQAAKPVVPAVAADRTKVKEDGPSENATTVTKEEGSTSREVHNSSCRSIVDHSMNEKRIRNNFISTFKRYFKVDPKQRVEKENQRKNRKGRSHPNLLSLDSLEATTDGGAPIRSSRRRRRRTHFRSLNENLS